MPTEDEEKQLSSSPPSSLPRFPLSSSSSSHSRSFSSPSFVPPATSSHAPYPSFSFSAEQPPPNQEDRPRPPTPHRGFSLAVPSPLPPSHQHSQPSERRRLQSFGSATSGRSEGRSVAATRGSEAGSVVFSRRENGKSTRRGGEENGDEKGEGGEEGLEELEMGARGLSGVRSRETIRTARTQRSRGMLAPSPVPTAASVAPIEFVALLFLKKKQDNPDLSPLIPLIHHSFRDVVTIYALVCSRRGNFDLLLWSVRHNVDPADCAHGETWAKYRQVLPPRAKYFKWLAGIRGFTLWSNGMLIIGLVALGVLVTAAVKEDAFQNCQNN
ncbi:hypothetical protein JCM8547_009173 [Rhodosporidiobolus lusitaniae]